MPSLQEYYQKLQQSNGLILAPKQPSEISHLLAQEHLHMNFDFLLMAYSETPYKRQFQISSESVDGNDDDTIYGIGKLFEQKYKDDFTLEMPKNPWFSEKIEISKLKIQCSEKDHEYEGFLVLISFKNLNFKSEPAFFKVDNNGCCTFTQVDKENRVYFNNIKKEDIGLSCFLFSKNDFGNSLYSIATASIYNENGDLLKDPSFDINGWSKINLNDYHSGLFNTIKPNCDKGIYLSIESELELELCKEEKEFVYSWNEIRKGDLYCLNLKTEIMPLITISDIFISLNEKPTANQVFFKAYLKNEFEKISKNIDGEPVFVSSNGELQTSFTSSIVPASVILFFPNIIQIYIKKQFTENTHLVIVLYGINSKNEVSILNAGIINFDKSKECKCALVSLKNVTKDIISSPKQIKKKFFSCSMKYPNSYFVPDELLNFSNIKSIPIKLVRENIIVIFTQILNNFNSTLLENWVDMVYQIGKSSDDPKKFINYLCGWVYHIFMPSSCGSNLLSKYKNILTQIFKFSNNYNNSLNEEKKNAIQYSYQFFIDIFIVLLTEEKGKYTINDVNTSIIFYMHFLKQSSNSYQTAKHNIYQLKKFILIIVNLFDFNEIFSFIIQGLTEFSQLDNILDNKEISKLLIDLLKIFTMTPVFITGFASLFHETEPEISDTFSPYCPNLSKFMKFILYILHTNDNESIIELGNILCYSFEKSPKDLTQNIAFSMIPFLNLISNEFDETLNEKIQYFISFILFVFNNLKPIYIRSFFLIVSDNFVKSFSEIILQKCFNEGDTLFKYYLMNLLDFFTLNLYELPYSHFRVYQSFINLATNMVNETDNFKQILSQKYIENLKISKAIDSISNIKEYELEQQCQMSINVANVFVYYPVIRLKWLRECLRINNENNDLLSSFVTRLHIIALLFAVHAFNSKKTINYYGKNCHLPIVQPFNIPFNDNTINKTYFSFMHEVQEETFINFDLVQQYSKNILSKFTVNSLIQEVDETIELGEKLGLYYTVRAVLSTKLNIFNFVNISNELSGTFDKLSNILNLISTKSMNQTHLTPISFFLIEIRESQNNNKRFIYFINDEKNADNFDTKEKTRKKVLNYFTSKYKNYDVEICHEHEYCSDIGVCIIPIEPLNDPIYNMEHSHCWLWFTNIIDQNIFDQENTKIDDEIVTYNIQAQDYIPHLFNCVQVQEFQKNKIKIKDYIDNKVNNIFEILSTNIKDVTAWLEYDNTFNEENNYNSYTLFSKESEKIVYVVNQTLYKGCDFMKMIQFLKQRNKEKAISIAEKSSQYYRLIVKLLYRFVKLLSNNEENSEFYEIVKQAHQTINEYFKEFGIDPCTNDFYRSKSDLSLLNRT